MNDTKQLLLTLKSQLKLRGMTYRDVARQLNVSEASIKRCFSTGNLSLKRLLSICAMLDLTLSELAQLSAANTPQIHRLDIAQETKLVSEPKLLLIATCALNHWTLTDIITHYTLNKPECLQYLLQLERMRLIELLPGNRIRLRVARDFDWIPGGPIARYFAGHYREDFLSGNFQHDDETLFFLHGMLTPQAKIQLAAQLSKLRKQFVDLHDDSRSAAIGNRQGCAMLVAWRDWEPTVFQQLRRIHSHQAQGGQ